MSTNKGLAIGIGAIALAGGVLYYLSRDVGAEPPQDGEQRCNGVNLEEYQGGQWIVILENSPECGYVPASLWGIVRDADTGDALGGILVNTGTSDISDDWQDTMTDSEGRYEFVDLPLGPRPILFSGSPSKYEYLQKSITLHAGINELSVNMEPKEINIHGTIRDSISRKAVAEADVRINGIQASSQSDGLYWLWHMPYAAPITITIVADGYEPYEETIQNPEKVMTVDIDMVALEEPPPPPPQPEFQLTGMNFTYVRNNLVHFRGRCIPLGQMSSVTVGFDKEVSGQLSVVAVMTPPSGVPHPTYTHRNSVKADNYGGMKIGYIPFGSSLLSEGNYLWEITVYLDGELAAYNEFTVIGTREPWNCP